jgi:ribosomal protein L12E/L44/L45/RPP1/RPP2
LINNFNHFVNYTAEEKKKEEKKEESEEEDDDMGFGLFD